MEKIPEKYVSTRINSVGNTLFVSVSQLIS